MKAVVIGAHLLRDDVEPVAEAVPVGELFLSALRVADDQPIGDRELLLKVAEIRARLLETATFIAVRYGFAFSDPAEAHRKCAPLLDGWHRTLEANRGNVEMTLKVAASSSRPRPDRHDFASGAEYLRALHGATQAASADPVFRAEVERLIVPLAVQHRWIHRDEKSVELAILIARDLVREVNAAGESLRATRVPFLLSGPWPLEVFAE
jgi:hypothetical protein